MSLNLVLLLPFVSALMYGMGYVFLERVLGLHVNPATFLFINTLSGLAVIVCLMVFDGQALDFKGVTSALPVFLMVLAAASAPSLGWVMTIYSIKHISAIYTALAETSYPLFTLAFGFLFFGLREWNMLTLAGGAMILAGAAVMVYGQHRMAADE